MRGPVGQNYLRSEFGFCVGFFRICTAKLSFAIDLENLCLARQHVTRDLKIYFSKWRKYL